MVGGVKEIKGGGRPKRGRGRDGELQDSVGGRLAMDVSYGTETRPRKLDGFAVEG